MQQDFLQEDGSLPPVQKSRKPWLFGAVGFLLGAIIFFFVGQIAWYISTKPASIKNPFAGAKYGITGKVVLVEDNVLTVGVDSTSFGLPVTAYKVYTDGKTIFKKAVYAKSSGAGLNIFEAKPVSTSATILAEVALGTDIVAKSKSNIGAFREFTASEIELRTYQ